MKATKNESLWMAGVAILAAMVATMPSSKLVIEVAAGEPVEVLSAETLVYFEIQRPVEHFDAVASLEAWDGLSEAMAALAGALRPEAEPCRAVLRALSTWREDPETARQLKRLAGERLVIVLASEPGSPWPEVAVAVQGLDAESQLEALLELTRRYPDLGLFSSRPGQKTLLFSSGADAVPVHERQRGNWLVLSPSTERVGSFLATVSSQMPGAGSLSENETFGRLMSELPAGAAARAFLNTPALGNLLDRRQAAGRPGSPVVRAWLRRTEGVALARHVSAESIDTWIAVRFAPAREEDSWSRWINGFSPLRPSHLPGGPDDALAVFEAGINPGNYQSIFTEILAEVFPPAHSVLTGLTEEFRISTGLDPSSDLFPRLDDRFKLVVLSAEAAATWPWPRPVIVVRTQDPAGVEAYLYQNLRWKAGAVAALTGGWVSGMLVGETFQGVKMTGLQLEGIISLALPSPTYAVMDGVVLLSPSRSAVREMITSIREGSVRAEDSLVRDAAGSAVEAVFLDLPGWARELSRLLDRIESRQIQMEIDEDFRRILEALTGVLGALGPARGVTTLGDGGVFLFHLQIQAQVLPEPRIRSSQMPRVRTF